MSPCETPVALDAATAAVCERDPALPMLPLLLDDGALSTWLTAWLGEPVVARRRYLRYKVGTACVAAVRLQPGGRVVSVAHWTASARDKLVKTHTRAAPGTVLAVDHEHGLLVTTPAADRHLPGLARVVDPARRARALRGLVEEDLLHEDLVLRPLSYKPQRRWVGAATAPDGRRVLLRAYRPGDLALRVAASQELRGSTAPVPRLLGTRRHLGLAAHTWVEGRQLVLPRDGDRLPALGEAVARLHTHPTRLPGRDDRERARGLHATTGLGAVLRPDLADRLRAAAHTATAALAALPTTGPVLLHGDLSADQVVVGPDGTLSLIDLDRARAGHPADDLGSLLATAGTDAGTLEAALQGYATRRPRPDAAAVATYAAVHLLERCTDAVRQAEPAWARSVEQSLASAESLLPTGRP